MPFPGFVTTWPCLANSNWRLLRSVFAQPHRSDLAGITLKECQPIGAPALSRRSSCQQFTEVQTFITNLAFVSWRFPKTQKLYETYIQHNVKKSERSKVSKMTRVETSVSSPLERLQTSLCTYSSRAQDSRPTRRRHCKPRTSPQKTTRYGKQEASLSKISCFGIVQVWCFSGQLQIFVVHFDFLWLKCKSSMTPIRGFFGSQFLWSNDVKTIHMPQPTKRIAEQGNIRLAESKIRNHPEDLEKHPSLIWIDLGQMAFNCLDPTRHLLSTTGTKPAPYIWSKYFLGRTVDSIIQYDIKWGRLKNEISVTSLPRLRSLNTLAW